MRCAVSHIRETSEDFQQRLEKSPLLVCDGELEVPLSSSREELSTMKRATATATSASGARTRAGLRPAIDGELRASFKGSSTAVVAGEAVGALALLDDMPFALDVRATKVSRLLRLTKRDLDDLLHDYPDLAVSLLHGMAARLRGMVS